MDAIASAGLKRKFEDADVGSAGSNSDDEISNSDSADSCDSVNPASSSGFIPTSILKRQKQLRRKNVRFDQVTVYYFARRQGFTSVPSQGGSSLGMAPRHNSVRRYTLCEFAQEQEVNHREILREHLKEEKLHAKKMKVVSGTRVVLGEIQVMSHLGTSYGALVELERFYDFFPFFWGRSCVRGRRHRPPALLQSHQTNLTRSAPVEIPVWEEAAGLRRGKIGILAGSACFPSIPHFLGTGSAPLGVARRTGWIHGWRAGRVYRGIRTGWIHGWRAERLYRGIGTGSSPKEQGMRVNGLKLHQGRDFQEFMAENETAVMHLQTAEELDRLKAEEDSSNASSVESLGVCILEEPLAVPDGLCPPLAAPILIQAQLPPGSSVLCF
ncbi:Cysteine/serine-rich nuclear protein 2, partial [Cuculus canorus]